MKRSISIFTLLTLFLYSGFLSATPASDSYKYENDKFSITLPKNSQLQDQKTLKSEDGKSSTSMYKIKVENNIHIFLSLISIKNTPVTLSDERNAITGAVDGMKRRAGINASQADSNAVYRDINSVNIDGKEYQIYTINTSLEKVVLYASSAQEKLYLLMFEFPEGNQENATKLISKILPSLIIK